MKKLSAIFVLLAITATASAVPSGVPKDPPAPPTGLGRLFGQEARLALDNCAVTSQTASNAVVGFSSTYPYRFRRFQRSDSTWTSWTTLPTGTTSWDCQGTCFHDTARVEIRGCENSTCATGATSECAILIGVPNNGPPELDWSGIETTSAGVLGCVQSDHTEIVVRLRYAGTHPLSGYPQIGGLPASERVAGRQDAGSVRNRVYAAPAGWTPADIAGGSWTTTVSLDSSGSRDVSLVVELSESCLSSPQAAIVGSGGTLAPIASGQMFIGGSELEIASGNPSLIYALTSHQLSHDGAPEPFGRITPATGLSDTAHTWTETAVGRDGLTYTSPDLDLTAQAMACESDGTHLIWLDPPGAKVTLPNSMDWTTGPTMRTDACEGIVTPENALNSPANSEMRLGAGSAATGWPVEARAKQPSGSVGDFFYWYGGNWNTLGSNWYFDTERELVCGSGERIVGNSCQTCPTYDECTGGTLTTKTWCDDGNHPLDDRRVSHRSCVSNVTVTEWACVDGSDPDPTDQPCVVTCGPGERDAGGYCEPCPTYRTCDASGNLATRPHCGAGTLPESAQIVNHQACQSGATVTLQACVAVGGSPPGNTPCVATCQANERLVSGVCQTCPSYSVCTSRASLSTRYWCEAGSPPEPDAEMVDVQACRDQFRPITLSRCWDGDRYTPADSPCSNSADPDCPMGERMDRGRCRDCPRIQVCAEGIPGSTTYIDWCWPGDPPPDVGDDGCGTAEPSCPPTTMPACAGGTGYVWNSGSCMWNELTRNPPRCPSTSGVSYWDEVGCRYRCGTDPDTTPPPPPPPPPPPGGIETYCDSYGNARTRPSGSSQNVNSLDRASDCTSGETLNGNSCCVAGCTQTARPACSSGRAYTWNTSQCRWIRSTVSRPSCGGQTATWDSGSCSWDCPNLGTENYCDSNGVAQERPASGTSDVDNLDKASDCTSSEELNSDSCCVTRSTQTYQACSNGVVTTETWTGSGNPVNDDTATHFYCVGAVKHADLICASVDDDDLPTSCSSGYSLNSSGCCAEIPTYEACSNGVVTTKPWTRSGNPVDDPTATRYFCIGATPDDELICASSDRRERPTSCGSGYSLNSDGCCEQDDIPPIPPPTNGTETYCDSSGVAKERTAPGTDDVDNLDKESDCTSRQALNSQSCCETLGDESYCDSSGNARTRLASGFQNVNNLDSVSDCASDEELNGASCCVEVTGPCEPSGTKPCVEGYTHSWSTTNCSYRRSTAKTPKPACQEPRSEATWSCSDEEWQHGTVTADACHANPQNTIGYIYDQWRSTSCAYASRAVRAPSCDGTLSWITSCKWECIAFPPIEEATISAPNLSFTCHTDGENIAACGVSFNSDGTITGDDINNPDWGSNHDLGTWATVPQGVSITEATGMTVFTATRTSIQQIGGSSTTCSGSTGGMACVHFGGGWVGNNQSRPGGCFNYTIKRTDNSVALGSGRVCLSGGGNASTNPGQPGQMN